MPSPLRVFRRYLWVALLLGIVFGGCVNTFAKTIIVFAPHPDDEALCCSGIIYAAKQAGDTVKVVVVTNGDDYISPASTSLGYKRESETMAGMATLGLGTQDVIFLGYGDQLLQQLLFSSSPTQVYTSAAGQTQTYADAGLGGVSYHQYLTGSPGPYNQQTILSDIEAVLKNYQPDDIYTTGMWDDHPDHRATYAFVCEALIALKKQGLLQDTRIHETWNHAYCEACDPYYKWPGTPFTPNQPFPAPEFLALTPYDWTQIESVPVPPAMQDPNENTNLKFNTIWNYHTQTGDNLNSYYFAFVKKNEYFWVRNFQTDVAVLATATASSQQSSGLQGAANAIDGIISGFPNPTDNSMDLGPAFYGGGEWVTNGELGGAWIKLTWPNAVTTSKVILYDRPNLTDNVLSGTLTFSDGSSIPVGALPPNGAGYPISFPSKTISWMQFTINSAQGQNTGLSEIEVFGTVAGSSNNFGPQMTDGPVASPPTIASTQVSNISASAFDVYGYPLEYTWTSDGGSITGSGASVTYNPPSTPGIYTVTLTVNDGHGNSTQNSTFVTVTGPPALSSLTLTSASIVSGGSANGTVTLSGPAAAGGATVTLSSSNTSVATVPASITVSAGSTSATFPVTALSVSKAASVTVTAAYGSAQQSASATVAPPGTVASVSLNPVLVSLGNSSTGTVTLNSAAPASGATVTLATSNTAVAQVVTGLTVPAGSVSAMFNVTAVGQGTAIITASNNGAAQTATIGVNTLVLAPNLATSASVTVSSQNVSTGQLGIKAIDQVVDGYPGDYTKEWATVGQLAGAWIQLSWSSPVMVSQVVLYDRPNLTDNVLAGTLSFSDGSMVPVGQLPNNGVGLTVSFADRTVTSVMFKVTKAVGSNIGLAEIAVYGPTGPSVTGLTLTPATVTGGSSASTGTIALSGPAPAGGASVALLSSNTAVATVPATVTVPQGSTTATFTITSNAVTSATTATIIATYNGMQTATLTVNPGGALVLAPNLATAATVTVSSQNVSTGQLGTKATDLVVDGYPGDYTKEWATVGQLAGAWIQLTWSSPVTVSQVVLYDRPNLTDNVLAGTLSFSDGSTVPVGQLPNNGVGLTVSFAARTITSLKFTVTQAVGANIGLAEIAVYGPSGVSITGLTLNPVTVTGGNSSTGTITLSGPAPTGGASVALLSSSTGVATVPATVTVPQGSTTAIFTVTTNAVGSTTTATITATYNGAQSATLTANGGGLLAPNLATSASVTVSSQNVSTGQLGIKAIDQVVDGYPGDYTKEWATVGQLAGAWIQLTWSSPVTVSQVVLYDRPNLTDNVLAGTLSFSDGSTVPVGQLPNNGVALTVSFAARTVTSLKFTVTKAVGSNIGLAEIAAYGP